MRKQFFILFLLSGYLSFAQNFQDIDYGTDDTFEVVSWNIEWFPKDGTTTLNYVKEIIEAVDADVFAIQEVDDKDMFRQIGIDLNGYESYIPDGDYSSLGYIYKSQSIEFIEIYKIYDTEQYWKSFPRAPLVLELKFKGQKYYVIDNHFKCCGDGTLDTNDDNDEENRRYKATNLLKTYIDEFLTDEKVILVGDLNDVLTDSESNNVFQNIIDDSENYLFVDMEIALGNDADWSYPSWPSHLDHILITNELFDDFSNEESSIEVIRLDDYMTGGWWDYDAHISDHRPVGLKIDPLPISNIQKKTSNKMQVTCFPNPIYQNASITVKGLTGNCKLDIYNSNGQLVLSKQPFSNEIKLKTEGWNSGVYILRVISENGDFSTDKILLQ